MPAVVVDLRVSERGTLYDVESPVASESDAKGSLTFEQQVSQDESGQRSVAPQVTAHSTAVGKEEAETLILGASVGVDSVAERSQSAMALWPEDPSPLGEQLKAESTLDPVEAACPEGDNTPGLDIEWADGSKAADSGVAAWALVVRKAPEESAMRKTYGVTLGLGLVLAGAFRLDSASDLHIAQAMALFAFDMAETADAESVVAAGMRYIVHTRRARNPVGKAS
ncbi:hypothetical protein KC352_g37489 [Hortaea werneckii]|nr:hypothetical protein KC352_g37489 [Hortaea werneckii]